MWRLARVAVLAFLVAAPLGAAGGPAVRGRVVDAGEPFAGAAVALVPLVGSYRFGRQQLAGEPPQPVATARSDEDGAFRLAAPEHGFYRLEVEAPGCVPVVYRLWPLVEDVDLPPAELYHADGVEVTVLDEAGAPVAGARLSSVTTSLPRDRMARLWRPGYRFGTTDVDGRAALPRGVGESVRVAAYRAGFAPVSEEVRGGRKTLRLPPARPLPIRVVDRRGRPLSGVLLDVGDWIPSGVTGDDGRLAVPAPAAGSVRFELLTQHHSESHDLEAAGSGAEEPPQEPPAERTYTLPEVGEISGRVVDAASGQGIPGALVWRDSGGMVSTHSDRQGRFRLPAVVGQDQRLGAGAPGYLLARRSHDAAAPEGEEELVMSLQPAASLVGTVVDEAGEPLAGVELRVALEGGGGQRLVSAYGSLGIARSDGDGRFRLAPLEPGADYVVVVAKRGYAPLRERVVVPRRGTVPDLELVLAAGEVGVGWVRDEAGEPIAGAEVSLRQRLPSAGPAFFARPAGGEPDRRATSDGDGRFELADLAPATYDLEVRHASFAPAAVPGIEVPPATPRFDIGTVILSPGVPLAGRVVDAAGEPVGGAEVVVRERGAGVFSTWHFGAVEGEADALSGADGTFELAHRRPGETLDLTVRRDGYAPGQLAAVMVPTEEPVVVTLERAGSIRGRVVDPRGEPVAGASVDVGRSRSTMMGSTVAYRGGTRSDDEGRFTVEGLEPGTVTLSVQARGWRKAEVSNLEVTAGEVLEGLVVRLEAGAVVHGTVTAPSGAPVARASVVWMPEDVALLRVFSELRALTDPGGRYRLEGVSPGRGRITVSHPDYADATRTVELEAGAEHPLDVELTAGYEVSGQLVDADGAPVVGAELRLQAQGVTISFSRPPAGRSEADGTFRLRGVAAGAYSLVAEHPEHAAAHREVTVDGRSVEGLLLEMGSGATISGRLLGLEPDALAGVRILAVAPSLGSVAGGEVDYEGRYRVRRVTPGDWRVQALLPDGRQTIGRVRLAAGDRAVTLDLDFTAGLTLSGRVWVGDAPLAGAQLVAVGVDVDGQALGATDHQGRFRLTGLVAGRYRLSVLQLEAGLSHFEEVALAVDREVEIRIEQVDVAVRVVDAAGQPLGGARVTLEASDGERGWLPSMRTVVGTTDAAGGLRLGELATGSWRIGVEKSGYARSEQLLELTAGAAPTELGFALEATAEVLLRVRGAGGPPPARVRLAALGADGRAVMAGELPVEADGVVRLTSLPPGSWELVVSAEGSATVSLPVAVPGAAPEGLTAVLVPGATLRLAVPGLVDQPGVAWAELTASAGRRFRTVNAVGQVEERFPLLGGRGAVSSLPAGRWTAVVSAADGRSWTTTVTVAAGEAVERTLE